MNMTIKRLTAIVLIATFAGVAKLLKSRYFLKICFGFLFSDILFVIVSFMMALTISGREPNKLDAGIVVFLMVAWYFSSKATNLYDDFRTVKFIDEFLLILPNIMVQMMVFSGYCSSVLLRVCCEKSLYLILRVMVLPLIPDFSSRLISSS